MICISLSPACLSCSSVALKDCWSVGKFSNSFFAAVGPISGKPSNINCFCSSEVLRVFDGLSPGEYSPRLCTPLIRFSYFLARRIRKFAVSSSSCV